MWYMMNYSLDLCRRPANHLFNLCTIIPMKLKAVCVDIVLVYWLDLMGGRWRLDVMLSMMMCCFLWDWSFCQLVASPFWTRLVIRVNLPRFRLGRIHLSLGQDIYTVFVSTCAPPSRFGSDLLILVYRNNGVVVILIPWSSSIESDSLLGGNM